jgi:ABC-2 type transport system ATP-binding protein
MKFPSPSSAEAVVAVSDLSRRFGPKTVLDQLSMYVPRGGVFGLVGENGAGKTTLIKHVLGLLRAETGSVRVFGRNPVQEPVEVLGRIGYLSEQPDLPGWMRMDELLRYSSAFYPSWDAAYAEHLRQTFALDKRQRIRTLSKGQKAKAALLIAQAHRPELLVLDEPSSGLDPVVRRDILEAIIRTVGDEGRTVFFSSHLLEEIERVADHIAMLHEGKMVLCGSLDEIKAQHRRMLWRFEETQAQAPVVAGSLSVTGLGKEWMITCNGAQSELRALAGRMGARVLDEHTPSLNELFIAYANRKGTGANQQGNLCAGPSLH